MFQPARNLRITFIVGLLFTVLAGLFLSLPTLAAQEVRLEGVVRDSGGAVISGASVLLQGGNYRAELITDSSGRFVFLAVPVSSGTVEVSADGFGTLRQPWRIGQTASISLVLEPASASEQVTVSAARTEVRLSETPGSTVLLSTTDVAATRSEE